MALIGDDYIIPYVRGLRRKQQNFFLILMMGGGNQQRLYWKEKEIELSKKNGKESTGFVSLKHSSFLFQEDETK